MQLTDNNTVPNQMLICNKAELMWQRRIGLITTKGKLIQINCHGLVHEQP